MSALEKKELSQEEKIETLKIMFQTLEVDSKAVFAEWCHTNIEHSAGQYMAQKMNAANEKMNAFIATSYDKVTKGGEKIFNATNEAFKKDSSESTNEIKNIFD